jgi:hypothetical protein
MWSMTRSSSRRGERMARARRPCSSGARSRTAGEATTVPIAHPSSWSSSRRYLRQPRATVERQPSRAATPPSPGPALAALPGSAPHDPAWRSARRETRLAVLPRRRSSHQQASRTAHPSGIGPSRYAPPWTDHGTSPEPAIPESTPRPAGTQPAAHPRSRRISTNSSGSRTIVVLLLIVPRPLSVIVAARLAILCDQ